VVIGLDGVRSVVERILDDRVEVWREVVRRDGRAVAGAGEEQPPFPGAALVWGGLGAVLTSDDPLTVYEAVLPVGAALVRVGDVLVVRGSARASGPRDAGLVGRRFRVADANVGIDPVVRMVRLEVAG
jgi:hypothetical protein